MKSLLIFSAIYPCKVQQSRSDGTYGDSGDLSLLTFGRSTSPILESVEAIYAPPNRSVPHLVKKCSAGPASYKRLIVGNFRIVKSRNFTFIGEK